MTAAVKIYMNHDSSKTLPLDSENEPRRNPYGPSNPDQQPDPPPLPLPEDGEPQPPPIREPNKPLPATDPVPTEPPRIALNRWQMIDARCSMLDVSG